MNIESLSLDQMRVALTVAEIGSFSGAARHLFRKQSAVSYAVATLERQLGLALFERLEGQRPAPTALGHVLLREMEAVVRNADEIRKKANAAAHGVESEVAIAIDSLYPAAQLAATLDGFAKRFPTVPLRIESDTMGAVQTPVVEGNCILGISGSYLQLPPGLIAEALTQITRLPVAAPKHPLAVERPDGQRLPSRLLLDHIQIVVTDRSEVTAGHNYSVYTGRIWRVSDLMLKRNLLIAGLGWGYMPDHLVADDLVAGLLRPLRIEGLRDRDSVDLIVIRRSDRFLGPAAQWVLSRFLAASTPVVHTRRNRRRDRRG